MPEPRPRPSRLRRVWRYTWRITSGLFFIILVTLLVCSFDDDRLDTSALRYEPRQIPDAENAYLVLAQAATQLDAPAELEFPRLLKAIRGVSWDDAEVAEWLHGRTSVIDTIRSLRRFHTSQAPVPQNLEVLLAEQPRLDLVGVLAAVEARRLHHQGDREGAISLTLDTLHTARLIAQSRGDIVYHLQALRVDEATTESACILASDSQTPLQDLTRLRTALTDSRPSRAEFTQAFAADYRRCEMMVAALDNQNLLPPKWKTSASRTYFLPYRAPFLFKPNQTLNYAIPDYLFSVRTIDLGPAERKTEADTSHYIRVDLCAQYDDLINAWGKRLAHDGLTPTLTGLLDHRLAQQTRISLAETLIALRLYHDAHDRELPATLSELVPAYLPAVPRDYFDGQPIKYSRELRALWSAGLENFTLTDADQAVHERELILPLCFDGSYSPWPRRDPGAANFAAETGDTHSTENAAQP